MNTTWREELAWSAGFFDGEGWVGAVDTPKQKRPPFARLSVPQVDRRVLDRFRLAVGVGRVFGPYRNYGGPGRQTRYDFVAVHLPQVQAIIAMLWAFLSPVKRVQAAAALTIARDAALAAPGRQRFKKLCKRGHDLNDPKNVHPYLQHGYESRRCRACGAIRMRESRERRTASALLEAT